MDRAVTPAPGPVDLALRVPRSKSLHQRALALATLCEAPVVIHAPEARLHVGEDVRALEAAGRSLGHWTEGALGTGRARLSLDLGLGATGFRFATALATLRPAGSRTLVTGRPALLRRPHAPLRRALAMLGARLKRRHSGAHRVHGGGLSGAGVDVDARGSSQYASALLLVAPRAGGLSVRLRGRSASLPYLRLTLDVLEAFGVPSTSEGLEGEAGTVRVGAATPQAERFVVEPDASCAAAWWTAAALTGGRACVPGIAPTTRQADGALLAILARMGARVDPDPAGAARVRGPEALTAPGDVDLLDAPDLLFLVGVLAAAAQGETLVRGVAHTRGKESDRVAVLAAGLRALCADVTEEGPGAIRIRGRGLAALAGAPVRVAGDHRAAFAFGVLGLAVSGIVLLGAGAVTKSHPGFLDDLATAGGNGRSEG
jgi:3-phosphoshikimate 1-carboxyvinyltransferase